MYVTIYLMSRFRVDPQIWYCWGKGHEQSKPPLQTNPINRSPLCPNCSIIQTLPHWPHGLQLARLLSPLLSPGVSSNLCPLNWSCHPTISSFVITFSSCPQSFYALVSFLMSQLFASRGQVLKLQFQHQSFQWIFRVISFRIDWLDLFAVQRTLKSLLQHHSWKTSILWCLAFLMVQLSHL